MCLLGGWWGGGWGGMKDVSTDDDLNKVGTSLDCLPSHNCPTACQVWHSCQQLQETGVSNVVSTRVCSLNVCRLLLRSGSVILPTFSLSALPPKLLHNCLGVLVLFRRHQRLEGSEVALATVQ